MSTLNQLCLPRVLGLPTPVFLREMLDQKPRNLFFSDTEIIGAVFK